VYVKAGERLRSPQRSILKYMPLIFFFFKKKNWSSDDVKPLYSSGSDLMRAIEANSLSSMSRVKVEGLSSLIERLAVSTWFMSDWRDSSSSFRMENSSS
jgi:hypothetical protein